MVKIAIVGCTGKLGSAIINRIADHPKAVLSHAIARPGNRFVCCAVSEITGGKCDLTVTDEIDNASDCDVFIDCTGAEIFLSRNLPRYLKAKKPLVIATTGFGCDDIPAIEALAETVPVFMSGNFSTTLHDFIDTLKFAVRKINCDTDIQIIEYHHNLKQDAPSGTALMIRDALVGANSTLSADRINICSVRGGSIFGEHEVFFANRSDEVVTFRHQVSSRTAFADGAIAAAMWMVSRPAGLYGMDDLCSDSRR